MAEQSALPEPTAPNPSPWRHFPMAQANATLSELTPHHQTARQKSLNLIGDSSVYRTVC
jgi:hypothetical protein